MIIGPLLLPAVAVKSFGLTDAMNYATHAVMVGKPRKQLIAQEGRPIPLELYLHAEWIAPQRTYDQLLRWMTSGEVLVVQANNGTVYGQFVIDKLTLTPEWQLPDETIISATCSVSLVEPGLETLLEVPAAPPGVAGNATDTTTQGAPEDIPPGADPFDAAFDPARF